MNRGIMYRVIALMLGVVMWLSLICVINADSFNPIITRYWKLTILDIPFTLQFITPSISTHPAYTTGDASRDIQAKTIPTSSQQGPCIQSIDIMAKKLFPHVPPKGTMIGSFQSLQFTAIWYHFSSSLH